ncbi:ATP-binding cassette domain-containing protein [Methylobacterium sp. WL30]|nr:MULTISPECIES: ATP-binding cassette domain-containing protein [unclassified Methylobacterium]TXM89080.1 ATP-binding cassette domain-containing protein [Methylobacterium sp. WL116]TXN39768.1 ATP-binding cassette domain-containing protein [Methylobacterium sp. WL93]TXN51625.1 ATP-binding cassette domain-containing protein [Methylobacterium sp. WL119]TXN64733.1 ATP-binding cassette domain-containing protein [Methylobacterium sp. WL30]
MAAPPLLTLQDIALTFGGTPLIEGAGFSVSPGERTCLVGRNGSGKSTLMKIAAGHVEPDRGVRFVQPGTTIRYLAQEPDFSGFATTLDFVEAGLGDGDAHHRARYLLESLGLDGSEDPTRLSGGEGRRVALAQALAPEPDVLLLDEPTNHLDLPAIEWLEAELKGTRAAMVLISHDRRFLSALSRATIWLDRGVTRRIEQGFSGFEAWRDAFFEEEERDRHKLERKINDEEHWLRYGVTARRKRNVRRLGNLHALRKERRDDRRPVGTVTMQAGEAEASGTLVMEAKNASKSFGERRIVADLSLRVMRGDRLGIVGANGAGKTTLINLLTGKLQPDDGSVRQGTNLKMMLLDQARAVLEPSMTVTEVLTGGSGDSVVVNGVSRHVVGYLKDFLFTPEQARTPVSVLSGGERNRLLIARALAQPANLLVLDEPTNDLDLETLDLLQEMLGDYSGTLILVSHDRDFLDRVVGSVLVSEGEGRWVEYAGGYSDMVNQRGIGVQARAGAKGKAEGKADAKSGAKADLRERADTAPASKAKLNFKDQHELKTLPARMEKLQGAIAQLRTVLADPGLYARDAARFDKASAMLAQAEVELSGAEERWLELEMLREG